MFQRPGSRSAAPASAPAGAAPGRRTLTSQLPPRAAAAAPAESAETAAAAAPSDPAQLARWMDDAVRPDLAEGVRSGAPLPGGVRGDMEAAFGTDLGAVRLHESGEPAALGALAFARGDDIHLAPGRVDLDTPRGREVLGHELTHVVQQRNGLAAGTQCLGNGGDGALEAEADALGARAAAGERVEVRGAGAGTQCLQDGDKETARAELEPEIRGAGLLRVNQESLLARLGGMLDAAPTIKDARTTVQQAICDLIVDEECTGLVAEDQETMRAQAPTCGGWRVTWSGVRASLRNLASKLRGAHVQPLGREAFLESPENGARARYSGAPLVDSTMEITIISHKSVSVGHSYVVFEWHDPMTPQHELPNGDRRRHELFHLFPDGVWNMGGWTQPPVKVLRERGSRDGYFPQKRDNGEDIPGTRRSWRVPYVQGALALARAADLEGVQKDMPYALCGWGGESCISWATHIAEAAGVNARSLLGHLVEIPVWENAGGEAVDSEPKMWAPRERWRAQLPRMDRIALDDAESARGVAGWRENLERRFRDGYSLDDIVAEVDAYETLLALRARAQQAGNRDVVERCNRAIIGLRTEDSGATALLAAAHIAKALEPQPPVDGVQGGQQLNE